MSEEFYTVSICGLTRHLPLFEVAPKVRIAIFNMLGDTEIVEVIADELARRVPSGADALMTAEVKSIPLAHALAVRLKLPYVVARKTRKPYMVGAQSVEVISITTGAPQTLWLDGKDLPLVNGKRPDPRGRCHQHRQHPGRDDEVGAIGWRHSDRRGCGLH